MSVAASTDRRARKLTNLRLFDDPATGKAWEKSVSDLGLEILCVSQVGGASPEMEGVKRKELFILYHFTLQFTLCHVLKGNKPDFHDAMKGEQSQPMYEEFLKLLGSMYRPEAVKGRLS